ncbi:MAG: undecaprenyl-diphosphate phosphatase, partial [Methylophilaceae bacterium]|nr:undecaprenyl-diphosphate phosphatase [Methylophilaceae bacterium]
MDFILILKAIMLGIVEGATEFLPISSTGHLIIVGDLIDFLSKEKRDVFEIVIQLGSILSVVWLYQQRFKTVVRTIASDQQSQKFVLQLFVAFLPLAILGLLFHHQIKEALFNPISVAIALIAGGLIILYIEKLSLKSRVLKIESMSIIDALKIGCAQALALIPGVSRAGATILGGMSFGLSRQVATEFSFFLAVPVMFAASGYDLLKNRHLLTMDDAGLFAIGFIAAFLSALIAIKTFIRFVAAHDFKVFAWYRIAL